MLKTRCSGDLFCGATVSLCFGESSKIFLCDKNERESAELYQAPADKVFNDLPLIGEAFFMTQREKEQCYIAATTLDRLDDNYSLADQYSN